MFNHQSSVVEVMAPMPVLLATLVGVQVPDAVVHAGIVTGYYMET
jgi:hypothetical protein